MYKTAKYMFGKEDNGSSVTYYCLSIDFFQVTEFCTEKTHNTEAPNLQNKMCNGKSTWDVIMNSTDFQNTSPMTEMNPPTQPTFSLLKSKQRVVCLVLDKSGSMSAVRHLFVSSPN